MGNSLGLGSDIIVSVQTGDRKGAGTNASVWFVARDEEDNASDEISLDQFFEQNFQRGKKDVFEIPRRKFSELTSPVDKIEIWRDYTGLTSTWFLDIVTVEDPDYNVVYTFPVFRWIRPNYRYVIQQYDTSLPIDDANPEQREMELMEARRTYAVCNTNPKLPVRVAQVPDDDAFPEDFKRGNMAEMVECLLEQLRKDPWTSLADISNMYTSDELYIPKEFWKEDRFFGYQRMNGINPGLIKLCTVIPEKLAVTDSMVKPSLEGQSLKKAFKSKRLFICDLDIFKDFFCPSEDTTICSPIALLYLNKKDILMPIAIQLFQEPSESNPVFLPSDDFNTWLLAKMWYNNAEANYHMAVTYIGTTCLLMESVGVSLHRQLCISHPIYKMMAPFFTYIMAENSDILQSLLSEDGILDRVMAIGVSGVKNAIKKGLESWRLTVNSCLPDDLVRREVFDACLLPAYHYRDDAVLVYYAIQNYVVKYIALYYESPESIETDTELQNWVKEMTASREENGMEIKGVPGDGSMCKPEQLQDLLTAIIFTCTVQRAAVGTAQYDSYGYPPNYPLKLGGKPPSDKSPRIEVDVLDALQNGTSWAEGVALASVLSDTVNKGVLCEGSMANLFDPRAVAVHNRFLNELDEIGKVIRERDTSRDHSYHYLIPSAI